MRASEVLALGWGDGLRGPVDTVDAQTQPLCFGVHLLGVLRLQVTLDCPSSQCGCDSQDLSVRPLETDYRLWHAGCLERMKQTRSPSLKCLQTLVERGVLLPCPGGQRPRFQQTHGRG